MKRLISLMLVLMLALALFAGCSSEPAATPSTPADTPATETPGTTDEPAEAPEEPADEPADTTDEPADEPAEPAVEPEVSGDVVIAPDAEPKWWNYTYGNVTTAMPEVQNSGLVELPLVDEPTTLTGFRTYGQAAYVAEPEDILCNVWLEEQTGVHMDWTHVNTAEQYQIFFTSGDYTDIVVEAGGTSAYTGGLDKGIEDDVYVAGNDYLQYMPNFMAYLNHSEEIRRDCVTDEGTYFFAQVKSGHEPPWTGPMVRGDWLEDLGLDIPTTYDDWDQMLSLFKSEKGAEAALGLSSTLGYDTMGHGLDAGYGAIGAFYAENGNTVKLGFIEDGFREYIAMMADWYGRGLINRDFMSHVMWVDGQGMVTSGATGAYDSSVYSFSFIYPMGSDEEMTWIPVPIAKKSDDAEKPHFRHQSTLVSSAVRMILTTAAVDNGNDVLAAKWIDYNYTMDCGYLWTFGEQGLDWEFNEEGVPACTDHYYNNPEGKSIYGDMKFQGRGSHVYIWWREFDTISEIVADAYHTWQDTSDAAYNIPTYGIALTAEEGEDYASPYSDIETYINENIPLFIRGDRSLDEWDDFVATLYQFGLQDCIDIYQAALDRYNAR